MQERNDGSGNGAPRIGCYTTARVSGGRVERVERHARRLCRDADRLGLPLPDRISVESRLVETARDAFGRGDGIVRIEWSTPRPDAGPGRAPGPGLRTETRPIGDEPACWRAATSRVVHPGPGERRNAKAIGVEAWEIARAEVRERAIDEVLLFDSEGLLVEGSRSNILLVDAGGRLLTPALELGPVEGIGLELVREACPDLGFTRLTREAVRSARELLAVNCVRGIVPITELDGDRVASGGPRSWARRLRPLFFRTAPA